MGTTTHDEFEAYVSETPLILLPLGAYEQHGRHCPMVTDSLIADHIANQVASQTGVHKLPPLNYGSSEHHMGFSGTVSSDHEPYRSFLREILESLSSHGVETVVVINGHGGNIQDIQKVSRMVALDIEMVNWWKVTEEIPQFTEDEQMHAGAMETSVVLAIEDGAIREDRVTDTEINDIDYSDIPDIDTISESGVLGTSSSYSKEKGETLLRQTVERIVTRIKDMETYDR